ncbi:hypothetical protein [Kitasatospora sp. MBT63]|uniref:hypothetical protein n=1 Tax=Kitasatospora sp. MBT63 TaxID=1444768 RepID=UPI000690E387|nr:hypothetical protein [Kitasatospora sp. MBT63]
MTVRVLAYELRRLRSLRSTWLIVSAVVCCDVAAAVVLTRQLPAGPLSTTEAVRAVTALVPLLPLPFAALGAGALGALSYRHEVRYPGLAASRVTLLRRLWLLVGKLVVLAPVALALAVLTLTLDALAVRLALPTGVTLGVFDDPVLRPELFVDGAPVGPARSLAAFVLLVVVSGWAGLLFTAVVRSAVAGLLALLAVPVLLEPAAAMALSRLGDSWPLWAQELMPFRFSLGRFGLGSGLGSRLGLASSARPGPVAGLAPAGVAELLVTLAVPGVVLLLGCLLAQLRRRAL